MELDTLTAIGPIDGRYAGKCSEFREVFSEYGLVKRRVAVECAWLAALAAEKKIPECKALSSEIIYRSEWMISGADSIHLL